MSDGYGPWLDSQDGRHTILYRQHGETGRIHEASADYLNALEAELDRLRTALDSFPFTWKTVNDGPRRLCFKGDFDTPSEGELEQNLLNWMALLPIQVEPDALKGD